MGHKLLTLPGVADMYAFWMITWNKLTESDQPRVFKFTLAMVKSHIQQVENSMRALVISTEAAHVDNAILLDYLTSKVALEEPEIGSTDPNILIDNNCIDDELHFGMPRGSGDCEDEGDDSDMHNAIPTTSEWRRAATGLGRFGLQTTDDNGNDRENGDDEYVDADADADVGIEASQAEDGSTQNMEGWGHNTRECEDWTVYIKPGKYDNGIANATTSDVSEAKTVLW